jgi:hypothetical protein
MHQLDNMTNLVREHLGERSQQAAADRGGRIWEDVEHIGIPLILTLAIGGLGFLLSRTLSSKY